jgi:hypothetical protein
MQLSGNMDILGNIVMIEFKIRIREQVLNIAKIPGDQVVHPNHIVSFLNKAVTKM